MDRRRDVKIWEDNVGLYDIAVCTCKYSMDVSGDRRVK